MLVAPRIVFGDAWQGVGMLGGLAVVGGLAVAIVSAALPTQLSVVRRVLAGLAGLACLLAAGLFVLFLVVETNDMPDGLGDGLDLGFGWSGVVVLAFLGVGMAAGLAGALISDSQAAPAPPSPPLWE